MKKKSLISMLVLALILSLALVINQPVQAATIKLNYTTVKLLPKKKVTLKISGTKKKVKWSSSNKKVATVSKKGVVTAKKTGTAYIYAKVAGKKKKCKIIVKSAKKFAEDLRSYILKKGKKKGSKYTISGSYITDDENEYNEYSISANKSNNKLVFEYRRMPDAPANAYTATITINLQSTAKGDFSTGYSDAYDPYSETVLGKINKSTYTKSGTGLTFTYVDGYYDNGGDDEESGYTETDDFIKQRSKNTIRDGFVYFDKLLYSKLKLKMNKIGFKKYK